MKTETITVNANHQEICVPCNQLRALLVDARVSIGNINLCELALRELLTNLVELAYEGNASGKIKVDLACSPSRVVIETRDTGKPAQVVIGRNDSTNPIDLKDGAYGTAIMQSLVDEVVYTFGKGTNTWKLVKKLRRQDQHVESV
jgi:anti-sigma regulatory factor (Ser/Thr protein kinase)